MHARSALNACSMASAAPGPAGSSPGPCPCLHLKPTPLPDMQATEPYTPASPGHHMLKARPGAPSVSPRRPPCPRARPPFEGRKSLQTRPAHGPTHPTHCTVAPPTHHACPCMFGGAQPHHVRTSRPAGPGPPHCRASTAVPHACRWRWTGPRRPWLSRVWVRPAIPQGPPSITAAVHLQHPPRSGRATRPRSGRVWAIAVVRRRARCC